MAGPGPAPNPNAKRTNLRVGVVRLPAKGRTGRTPKWPLPDDPRITARINLLQDAIEELEERELAHGKLERTERTALTRKREALAIAEVERDVVRETEQELWRDLWHTPQAHAWEQLGWTREVAQYVRHKAAAEIGSMEDSKEARLRADSLGLTPKAMRSLMWVIAEDELGDKRAEKQQAAAPATKRNLRAVDGGA